MRLRILHVIPATPYGGLQRFAADLVEEQRRQGLDARILSIYDNTDFFDQVRARGIPTLSVPCSRPSIAGALAFFRALTKTRAEIIHLHGILAWICALGFMKKTAPWVFHMHTYPGRVGGSKSSLNRPLVRHLSDAFICVSHSVRAEVTAVFPRQRAFTVANGVKISSMPSLAKSLRDRAPVFGIAMRLFHDKGAMEICRIASELARQCPSSRLLVAGDGPAAPEVKQVVERLGLAYSVIFLGHCSDMEDFWSQIDVSFFVSPRDTFGLTIIESNARGIPVVAYRTGTGSDEVLGVINNEFHAPAGDASELVRQAVRLSADQPLYENVRQQFRSRVASNYDLAKCATEITKVYHEVLKP